MRAYVLYHESKAKGLVLRSFHDRDRAIFEFMKTLGFYVDRSGDPDYPIDMHANAAGFRVAEIGEEWRFSTPRPWPEVDIWETTVLRGVESEG